MKKVMIELADTTFRVYRKRNGAIALHLKSYLIVHTDAAFRAKWKAERAKRRIILGAPAKPDGLALFLKGFQRCWVRLPGKEQQECEVTYCVLPERRWAPKAGLMIPEDVSDCNKECVLHLFWVETILGDKNVENCIADMKLMFRLNFPGRTRNEELFIRRKVPVVTRFTTPRKLDRHAKSNFQQ